MQINDLRCQASSFRLIHFAFWHSIDILRGRVAMSANGTSRHSLHCNTKVASLIGRLGSSTFRLSTTAVLMSLTGSRFSSESAPRPLYGAFLVKKFKQGSASFLFDLKVCFFVPTVVSLTPARAEAVKVGRCTNLAAYFSLARPHLDGFEHDGTVWCGRDDDQRGARFRARFNRATTLYSAGPRTRTMMQSCASAAKLRSGGPILPVGTKAKGHAGIPPPRTVIGASSQADGRDRNCGGAFSVLHSLCRTQNNAVWYNALPHKSPQGDQKLARQGHDHGLSNTASVLGAGSKPPRQGAVLLVQKEAPRQLNHASSDSSIAGTGQPFFPAFPPALVGRASEAGITRYGPSVTHVSRQHLVHQHVGRLDADPDHARQ